MSRFKPYTASSQALRAFIAERMPAFTDKIWGQQNSRGKKHMGKPKPKTTIPTWWQLELCSGVAAWSRRPNSKFNVIPDARSSSASGTLHCYMSHVTTSKRETWYCQPRKIAIWCLRACACPSLHQLRCLMLHQIVNPWLDDQCQSCSSSALTRAHKFSMANFGQSAPPAPAPVKDAHSLCFSWFDQPVSWWKHNFNQYIIEHI